MSQMNKCGAGVRYFALATVVLSGVNLPVPATRGAVGGNLRHGTQREKRKTRFMFHKRGEKKTVTLVLCFI